MFPEMRLKMEAMSAHLDSSVLNKVHIYNDIFAMMQK